MDGKRERGKGNMSGIERGICLLIRLQVESKERKIRQKVKFAIALKSTRIGS